MQWISDKIGGNKLATRLARRQIDGASDLRARAAAAVRAARRRHAALHLLRRTRPRSRRRGPRCRSRWRSIEPHRPSAALPAGVPAAVEPDPILPPHVVSGPRPEPPPHVAVALDLDLDALNAILFELWRTGYLDRQLAGVGLDRRFNTDPLVTEFLTVRLSPITLALPPVVSETRDGLRLAADARVTIADGDAHTVGRIFGALAFRVEAPARAVAVDVAGVELACEAPPNLLVPCYGDLVDAMRDRASDFHGALTTAFGDLLRAMFVDRHLGDPRLPAELVIHGASPSLHGGVLRLDLDASI